jgi:hypothetical protein
LDKPDERERKKERKKENQRSCGKMSVFQKHFLPLYSKISSSIYPDKITKARTARNYIDSNIALKFKGPPPLS